MTLTFRILVAVTCVCDREPFYWIYFKPIIWAMLQRCMQLQLWNTFWTILPYWTKAELHLIPLKKSSSMIISIFMIFMRHNLDNIQILFVYRWSGVCRGWIWPWAGDRVRIQRGHLYMRGGRQPRPTHPVAESGLPGSHQQLFTSVLSKCPTIRLRRLHL